MTNSGNYYCSLLHKIVWSFVNSDLSQKAKKQLNLWTLKSLQTFAEKILYIYSFKLLIHSAVCLIRTLLRQGLYGNSPLLKKVLIVTPSSLTQNWHQEFVRWLGRDRIHIFVVDQVNYYFLLSKFVVGIIYSYLIDNRQVLFYIIVEIKLVGCHSFMFS